MAHIVFGTGQAKRVSGLKGVFLKVQGNYDPTPCMSPSSGFRS